MITIIDYGLGNLGSIKNMLKRIGVKSEVTSSETKILKAKKIILPGVGAYDTAMRRLKELDLIKTLNKKALEDKIPIMGVCLGMQLLLESSEEGTEKGLGWIEGSCYKFKFKENTELKIPHMGWNFVFEKQSNSIIKNFENFKFYFVHSYHAKVKNENNKLLVAKYGYEFDCAVAKENIYGFQFHPEKSHKFGMQLFQNFAKI